MSKKLTDLSPCFVSAGGEGIYRKKNDGDLSPVPAREGIGLVFDCPCGCGDRIYVDFSNPVDGGAAHESALITWERDGSTFDELTLHPSIQRDGGCNWHGWVRKGRVITV